jgi:hypothetical protein
MHQLNNLIIWIINNIKYFKIKNKQHFKLSFFEIFI